MGGGDKDWGPGRGQEPAQHVHGVLRGEAGWLNETNTYVQKVLAQIIVLLGHHVTVTGKIWSNCVEFIIRLCTNTHSVELYSGVVATESLGEMRSNCVEFIIRLCTTTHLVEL